MSEEALTRYTCNRCGDSMTRAGSDISIPYGWTRLIVAYGPSSHVRRPATNSTVNFCGICYDTWSMLLNPA
jgi:hypothetical protein